jgi:hypothetical protein
MLAITEKDFASYGCPNCGCDATMADDCLPMNEYGVTCKCCGLHFMIAVNSDPDKITTHYRTRRLTESGEAIYEYPTLIRHPRCNVPSWNYETESVVPK